MRLAATLAVAYVCMLGFVLALCKTSARADRQARAAFHEAQRRSAS